MQACFENSPRRWVFVSFRWRYPVLEPVADYHESSCSAWRAAPPPPGHATDIYTHIHSEAHSFTPRVVWRANMKRTSGNNAQRLTCDRWKHWLRAGRGFCAGFRCLEASAGSRCPFRRMFLRPTVVFFCTWRKKPDCLFPFPARLLPVPVRR